MIGMDNTHTDFPVQTFGYTAETDPLAGGGDCGHLHSTIAAAQRCCKNLTYRYTDRASIVTRAVRRDTFTRNGGRVKGTVLTRSDGERFTDWREPPEQTEAWRDAAQELMDELATGLLAWQRTAEEGVSRDARLVVAEHRSVETVEAITRSRVPQSILAPAFRHLLERRDDVHTLTEERAQVLDDAARAVGLMLARPSTED